MAKSETSTDRRPPRPVINREREALHRIVREVPRLVRHGTAAIAVDVPILVAARHHVVAALAKHGARGATEQLLALLVPENDAVGGIDGEDGFSAPGDAVEGFVGLRHVRPRG